MSKSWGPRYYPPSTPRAVEGGIRARSTRGKIAGTWWSTRFIEVLESFGMGSRLTRGKNYARRGQVIALDLDAGLVTASVQGSRVVPYRVRIGVTAYGKDQWARLEARLASDAWFVAQLLAGEMPPDIEQVFADVGLTLFPAGRDDISLDCSCPDWGVPCKHLAAACYLLAERFDADPFDLLAWRGRNREDLLARVNAAVGPDAGSEAAVPLTELLDAFWTPPHPVGRRATSGHTTAPLDELPPIRVNIGSRPLSEVLRPAYDLLTDQTTPAPETPRTR